MKLRPNPEILFPMSGQSKQTRLFVSVVRSDRYCLSFWDFSEFSSYILTFSVLGVRIAYRSRKWSGRWIFKVSGCFLKKLILLEITELIRGCIYSNNKSCQLIINHLMSSSLTSDSVQAQISLMSTQKQTSQSINQTTVRTVKLNLA